MSKEIDSQEKFFSDICQTINQTENSLINQASEEKQTRSSINSINNQIKAIADLLNVNYSDTNLDDYDVGDLNIFANNVAAELNDENYFKFSLSATDYVVAALSGIIATAIDVIFVGTPEVVKLYRGGEDFNGSILTEQIRKINSKEGITGAFLTWISEKCQVPYDISCLKGVVTPDNHRLRCLAHDPFFGLFFAVADIIMGTTTCIDDTGRIRILLSYETSMTEKLLSVLFYLGHIISDLFTARGIPIPGFFLTQFFAEGTEKNASIAKIAEGMYKDGYDLRHLVSMSVPVAVEHLLIEAYCRINEEQINPILPIAEKEIIGVNNKLHKDNMIFIADTIGITGNIVKFVLPPVCCNPCALNILQCIDFIKYGLKELQQLSRDESVEEILSNRIYINGKCRTT